MMNDMKAKILLRVVTAAGAALTMTAPAGAAQGTQEFRLSGREVAVYNLAGEARIVRGQGSDVVVRVDTQGSDAAQLDIEVGRVNGAEALRILYPSSPIVYPRLGRGSSSTVRVSSDGTFSDGGGRGGDRVEVRGSGRGLEAYADLEIEVPAGRELALHLAVGTVDIRGVEGDFIIDTGSGPVTAQDIVGSVNIDTGSGHVAVLRVDGEVVVDTGSGRIEVADVRGREINVDTGSGPVTGSNLTAARVRIDTGSGRIELDQVSSSEIHLDTGSGSVRVDLTEDVETLVVDTGSGSVTVSMPETVGAELEVETGSGGIDLEFPVQIRRASRDHVVGTIGDGRGTIRIDTGSGNVRLARQ